MAPAVFGVAAAPTPQLLVWTVSVALEVALSNFLSSCYDPIHTRMIQTSDPTAMTAIVTEEESELTEQNYFLWIRKSTIFTPEVYR